ncbi:MAG: dihydropteroate synthase [Myxococcota bacterium]
MSQRPPEPSPFVIALHQLSPLKQAQVLNAVGLTGLEARPALARFLIFHLSDRGSEALQAQLEPGMILSRCATAPIGYAPPLMLALEQIPEQVPGQIPGQIPGPLRPWLAQLSRELPLLAELIGHRVEETQPVSTWQLPQQRLKLERPCVMAILNVTPDSFYDGGRYHGLEQALERAAQAEAEGADILDIGGESSRPGAATVSEAEELARVIPLIEALASRTHLPISVDTTKAEVARRAVEAGAQIINDISGFVADPKMVDVLADSGAAGVVMHMRGTPQTMQQHTHYLELMSELVGALASRVAWLTARGVARQKLAIDPGIGFAKEARDNLVILNHASMLHCLGLPVLVGASRKSFLSKIFGLAPEERLEGSLAAAMVAAARGVQVLRVHDVQATRRTLNVFDGILQTP